MRSRRRRGLASRVADACGLPSPRRCFPAWRPLMWFRRGFPARGRRRRGAARMRRGETAQRWHLFVVSTSERLPAALPPARTRVLLVSSVVKRRLGSGYFRASRLGDFLTFANRPPLPPPPTAVPQDFQDQEDHGQEAEAEPPHPPVDPHAHRQHHQVRPPPRISRVLFRPVQGVVCGGAN